MSLPLIILDTNTIVAAGFNPDSYSARIIREVRKGRLRLLWNQETRKETERIVEQIPSLSWKDFSDLFRSENCYLGETYIAHFNFIPDPEDRKFAALSEATKRTLVTQDEDLLKNRDQANIPILTPAEFLKCHFANEFKG